MSANESALTATTILSFTVLTYQSPSLAYRILMPMKTGREIGIFPAG
jgi:hypothetical protein